MLVLSRKRGQSIIVNQDIEIFITSIEGDQVKIGIKAPKEYAIIRKEVLDDVRISNQSALSNSDDIDQLKNWAQSRIKE